MNGHQCALSACIYSLNTPVIIWSMNYSSNVSRQWMGDWRQHGFESWWRFSVSVMEKVLPEVEHLARCCPGTSCPQECNQSQLAPKELFCWSRPRSLLVLYYLFLTFICNDSMEHEIWTTLTSLKKPGTLAACCKTSSGAGVVWMSLRHRM